MDVNTFLLSGVVFGLAAGMSPGPLLTLVITETLRHGFREGVKVAIAPLITDLPIILVTLFVLSRFADMKPFLGWVSMMGGFFIAYLAYESITIKDGSLEIGDIEAQSLRKGIVANFLNPHPYMFWSAVGAPTLMKALNAGVLSGVYFVCGFYALIVGSKVMIALTVGNSRSFLRSKAYLYSIKALGFVLLVFAALFVLDGLRLFGLIRN
jgi:threonine/homoserine/homoserine lactone efflux protein